MDPELQNLAIRLGESLARNTAAAISDRIHALKARRDDKNTIAELEAMVGELIADKSELVQIAQAFQEELVAQQISDSDVDYITKNVIPVFETLMQSTASDVEANQAQQFLDLLRPILSVETITILQLLGFNFRRGIGLPLTELVSRAIASKMPGTDVAAEIQALNLRRELAFYEVAKDPDAYSRLNAMMGK